MGRPKPMVPPWENTSPRSSSTSPSAPWTLLCRKTSRGSPRTIRSRVSAAASTARASRSRLPETTAPATASATRLTSGWRAAPAVSRRTRQGVGPGASGTSWRGRRLCERVDHQRFGEAFYLPAADAGDEQQPLGGARHRRHEPRPALSVPRGCRDHPSDLIPKSEGARCGATGTMRPGQQVAGLAVRS